MVNNRRFWFGAVIVAIGLALFLNNLDFLPGSYWIQLLRLWPLVLVLWGLELLTGKGGITRWGVLLIALALLLVMMLNPGMKLLPGYEFEFSFSGPTEHVSIENLEAFAQAQEADIGKGILRLDVDGADIEVTQGGDVINGDFRFRGESPRVAFSEEGDTGIFTINTPGSHRRMDVNLRLGRDVDWQQIDLDLDAVDADLDLAENLVREVILSASAADVNMELNPQGSMTVRVDVNAGDVNVIIPAGTGLKIVRQGGSVTDLKVEGFHLGSNYTSDNFSSATDSVEVFYNGNVSSLTITAD